MILFCSLVHCTTVCMACSDTYSYIYYIIYGLLTASERSLELFIEYSAVENAIVFRTMYNVILFFAAFSFFLMDRTVDRYQSII